MTNRHPDPAMRDALRTHLLEQVRAIAPEQRPLRRRELGPNVVTGAVAAVVLAGTVAVLQLSPAALHHDVGAPVPTSSATAQRVALEEAIPTATGAETALTWSDQAEGAVGGPVDLTGKSVLLTGACTGGGTITITVTGQPATRLRCDGLHVTGPTLVLDRTKPSTREAIGVTVAATAGQPRYLVRTSTINPADTPTVKTTSQCTNKQLSFTATDMNGAAGTDYGHIAIRNTSVTPCTLHGTPTMYLTDHAGGRRIGGATSRLATDSTGTIRTVTLRPKTGQAFLRVGIVNIAGYLKSDGHYYSTCGHAVTGRNWELTLPGTTQKTDVPLRHVILLCSNLHLSISGTGPFTPTAD